MLVSIVESVTCALPVGKGPSLSIDFDFHPLSPSVGFVVNC